LRGWKKRWKKNNVLIRLNVTGYCWMWCNIPKIDQILWTFDTFKVTEEVKICFNNKACTHLNNNWDSSWIFFPFLSQVDFSDRDQERAVGGLLSWSVCGGSLYHWACLFLLFIEVGEHDLTRRSDILCNNFYWPYGFK
jgi:hypothetical protein